MLAIASLQSHTFVDPYDRCANRLEKTCSGETQKPRRERKCAGESSWVLSASMFQLFKDLRNLSNARVAFPLDVGHFACRNVHLKWAEATDSGFSSLQEDFVMTGRQRHAKTPLVISGK